MATENLPGMDEGGPSRTAMLTAYARAYHQIADDPLILDDPIAGRLLGVTPDELRAAVEPGADRPGIVAAARPRRLFFASRARFAEDRIAAAAADGTRQVVILGAGMDTFAYRNPFPDVHVFEVDHPATQEWKRGRLADAGIGLPATLTFAPVDFETDSLADRLDHAGLDRARPAVFVWLGVTYYLTPGAIRSTLGYAAGQAAPSDIVIDYLQPADTDEGREHLRQRAERVASIGEPWHSYFTPASIAAQLGDAGFTVTDDLAGAELVHHYLGTPAEERTPQPLGAIRILSARS